MIYVVSDIHGNERRFRSVMKQIHLQHEDTLYVLRLDDGRVFYSEES